MRLRNQNKRLTKREREIVGLMLEGYSNAGLQKKLGCVRGTITTHISLLYKKLGICNRAGLIKKALELGIYTLNKDVDIEAAREG